MATRRPNMPRANRGAGGSTPGGRAEESPRRADEGDAAGAAGLDGGQGRGKVVPLGAVPDPARAAKGAPSRSASSKAPASGSAGSRKEASGSAAPTAGPARPRVPRPRTGATRPAAQKAAASPAQKPAPKVPPAEKRARERAELTGAIRRAKKEAVANRSAEAGGRNHAGAGTPVPARTFSGRMIVLAFLLVAVAALLLPTVGTYVRQQGELSELRGSIAAKQAEQKDLKRQIARWDDPAYIRQQARDRINLVMPGERKYMVIGSVAEDEPVPESQSSTLVRTDLPWVDALWDTVQRAATD